MVRDALREGALINLVNWAETLSRLTRDGIAPNEVIRSLEDAGVLGAEPLLRLVPVTEEDALYAAELHPATRAAGLSLGDVFCLATAARYDLPVLTADRAWAGLNLPDVNVRLIR